MCVPGKLYSEVALDTCFKKRKETSGATFGMLGLPTCNPKETRS
jgi:hypothetical protein